MSSSEISVIVLEVQNLNHHALRLSECGGHPLQNGDQIVVLEAIHKRMLSQYAPHLKAVGTTFGKASLASGHYELSTGSSPAPVQVIKEEAVVQEEKSLEPTEALKSDKSMSRKSRLRSKGSNV